MIQGYLEQSPEAISESTKGIPSPVFTNGPMRVRFPRGFSRRYFGNPFGIFFSEISHLIASGFSPGILKEVTLEILRWVTSTISAAVPSEKKSLTVPLKGTVEEFLGWTFGWTAERITRVIS